MPRKRPLHPLRHQYSRDLKRTVIHQAYTLGYSSSQIATSLNVPLRVVQRVRKVWGEIGEVCKDRTRLGRGPLMTSDHADVSVCDFQLESDLAEPPLIAHARSH
jgi:transposase